MNFPGSHRSLPPGRSSSLAPGGSHGPGISTRARGRWIAHALLSLGSALAGLGQTTPPPPPPIALAPVVTTATRAAASADTLPVRVDVLTGDTLRAAPAFALDDALRASSAAFALFRRTGSLTANPTAQGVSLRGLGPSGASRSLVLLDGVPLTDPFGGWVAWGSVPTLPLTRAELVRGGGSAAWGSSALGGTVQLFTTVEAGHGTTPDDSARDDTAAGSSFEAIASLGDFGLRSGEVLARAGAFTAGARALATDGPFLLAPGQRGPIDRPLDTRHALAHASFTHAFGARAGARAQNPDTPVLTVSLRAWDEERGNGTPAQRNTSELLAAAVRLGSGAAAARPWELTAYAQDQTFASGFSGVAADRRSETPALDQFDVPARAAGAAFTHTWRHAARAADSAAGGGDTGSARAPATDATTTLGADVRWVEGETREHFFWSAADDDFLRERRAGGTQTTGGLFAAHARPLPARLHATLQLRADAWRDAGGFRRETIRATGAAVRDDHTPAREGTQLSPGAGLTWAAARGLTLRAAGYRAFRLPTLNELHRPFRVGAITTEANPTLPLERATSGELGATWRHARGEFTATAFRTELRDAVTAVSLNATTRQRRPLARVRSDGLEFGATWRPTATFALGVDTLHLDSTVRAAPLAPALTGRTPPQVPAHTVAARVSWQPAPAWAFTATTRWTSAAWEDDENTLRLAPGASTGLSLAWTPTPRWQLRAAVENLFDAALETARTREGLVSLAPPRWARAEVRIAW